jgi:hypothetical protein
MSKVSADQLREAVQVSFLLFSFLDVWFFNYFFFCALFLCSFKAVLEGAKQNKRGFTETVEVRIRFNRVS